MTLTRPGEIAEIVFAGGAGYGDPHRRDPAALAADLRDDRISQAAAETVYGAAVLPIADAAE